MPGTPPETCTSPPRRPSGIPASWSWLRASALSRALSRPRAGHDRDRLRLRIHLCSDEVLAAMTDTAHRQGMIAVATPIDVPLAESLSAVGDGFVVVLTNVRDPGNAGTVLRAADAFGAAAVLVSDASVDVYNPKVVRSTVGSLFHLPVSVGTPIPELLAACQQAGLRVLAADGSGETSLPDVDLSVPHAWVMGNEAWGLEPEVRDLCDDVVSIPIVRAESLNLAMAATVCLHASASRAEPAAQPGWGRPL